MASPAHKAFFDIHPVTGASIEVFFADRSLETFGWRGAGWFWWPRRSGFAPTGPAIGPFPTGYAAYRNAMASSRAGEFTGSNGVPPLRLSKRAAQVAKRLQRRPQRTERAILSSSLDEISGG
ncbi:hypothetical protein [Bradyrhizobium sp. USDA 4504]